MTAADVIGQSNEYEIGSFDVDLTPPLITSTEIDPYAALVNGTVFLNATAANGNVTLWAVVTLPNSSETTVGLPNGYFNVTIPGRHNVTFYANDTAGNLDLETDYFMTSEVNQSVVFNVVDGNLTGIATDLDIYLPGKVKLVQENIFTGIEVDSHPGLLYDLFYTVLNGTTILLRDVNITLDNNRTLGVDLLSTPVNGYILTFGVNNTYTIANSTIVLNYSNAAYTNENYLGFYKCADWNFTGRACLGTWVSQTATQDKTLDTYTFTVSGFSAFSIKQETVPSAVTPTPSAPSAGGGGGIICKENWECSSWSPCVNDVSTRICYDTNACGTEQQKPDESRSCDEALIYCYDNVLNQDESDVDCGGKICGLACENGKACFVNSDCESENCVDGVCEIFEAPAPIVEEEKISRDLLVIMFLVLLAGMLLYLGASRFILVHKKGPFEERVSRQGLVIKQKALQVEKYAVDKEIAFVTAISVLIVLLAKSIRNLFLKIIIYPIRFVIDLIKFFIRKEKYFFTKKFESAGVNLDAFEKSMKEEEKAAIAYFKRLSWKTVKFLGKAIITPFLFIGFGTVGLVKLLGKLRRTKKVVKITSDAGEFAAEKEKKFVKYSKRLALIPVVFVEVIAKGFANLFRDAGNEIKTGLSVGKKFVSTKFQVKKKEVTEEKAVVAKENAVVPKPTSEVPKTPIRKVHIKPFITDVNVVANIKFKPQERVVKVPFKESLGAKIFAKLSHWKHVFGQDVRKAEFAVADFGKRRKFNDGNLGKYLHSHKDVTKISLARDKPTWLESLFTNLASHKPKSRGYLEIVKASTPSFNAPKIRIISSKKEEGVPKIEAKKPEPSKIMNVAAKVEKVLARTEPKSKILARKMKELYSIPKLKEIVPEKRKDVKVKDVLSKITSQFKEKKETFEKSLIKKEGEKKVEKKSKKKDSEEYLTKKQASAVKQWMIDEMKEVYK